MAVVVVILAAVAASPEKWDGVVAREQGIRLWPSNPRYWEYAAQPTLLLGGTDDDNLIQGPAEMLESQLKLLRQAGGNFVRTRPIGGTAGSSCIHLRVGPTGSTTWIHGR